MKRIILLVTLISSALSSFPQGPLQVSITASKTSTCQGVECELTATVTGGNPGNYTLLWTAKPADPTLTDLTSSTVNVRPLDNTTYFVEAFDGNEYANDSLDMEVLSAPVIELGEDIFLCPFDSVILDAGSGYNYAWCDGSTERYMAVGSSGIGYDVKTIWVMIEAENGCGCFDSVKVYFDFGFCMGTNDPDSKQSVSIRPNPNNGRFVLHVDTKFTGQTAKLTIHDIQGRSIWEQEIKQPDNGLIDQPFDLTGLPEDIYLIRLIDEGRLTSNKLIIAR